MYSTAVIYTPLCWAVERWMRKKLPSIQANVVRQVNAEPVICQVPTSLSRVFSAGFGVAGRLPA
ncbi:hypothetical protein [Nonomuraea aurantiaca]|uniref:hypothetical protein n=1 Tax=Nonomuraea aurantiaca TaxID=2878562 RepID=UPI001CD9B52F|nr:hypothetical protein [Nonomuraea aurantiaca]MCA2226355.1 hypothetical protein [Nonomuraea aurantiaca]